MVFNTITFGHPKMRGWGFENVKEQIIECKQWLVNGNSSAQNYKVVNAVGNKVVSGFQCYKVVNNPITYIRSLAVFSES